MVIMKKYRLFFEIIKQYSIVGAVFGAIFIGGLYAMCIIFDDPLFSISNVNTNTALMGIAILGGLGVLIPKTMYNTRALSIHDKYMMELLPISILNKYMIIVISALAMFFSAILMSFPLEIIGSMLTTNYSPDRQIVVGGMIRDFIQSGIIASLLAEISFGLFCGILFRNTLLTIGLTVVPVGYAVGFIIGEYTFGVRHGALFHIMPMQTSIISIFLTIVFLALGYQIFKRWQLANDGVLMI